MQLGCCFQATTVEKGTLLTEGLSAEAEQPHTSADLHPTPHLAAPEDTLDRMSPTTTYTLDKTHNRCMRLPMTALSSVQDKLHSHPNAS